MINDWNDKLSFLQAIRNGWCNTDYIEFLIQKVWRIDQAVDVVDFGCGFGYIGLLVMPFLPQASTYTGIDVSEVLLKKAKDIFVNSPFRTEFIQRDFAEYTPEQNYDVAISQAVLRHIPNPKNVLEKMVQSVRSGGLVICMETDRLIQESGKYFSNIDYTELGQTELYKKLWKNELERGGRDYRTGLKIPQYMQELGLSDIQIRVNDSVKFANPYAENYETVFNSMAEANGWTKVYNDQDRQNYIIAMRDKGLSKIEAEQYFENEMRVQSNVRQGFKKEYIIEMPSTPITFGRKLV